MFPNQVLLVSDQPMANFLPILDEKMRPKTVTLAVSAKMRERAQWLKNEIEKQQVEILPDIDVGTEVSNLHELLSTFIKWGDPNTELFANSVLNATGGTKPMAIAAQEAFRMGGRPVFYVDISTDCITWIGENIPEGKISLSSQPTLHQFLGLNGITIKSGDFKSIIENEKWRHFYEEVSANFNKWENSIKSLNAIASRDNAKEKLDFQETARRGSTRDWDEMRQMLHADELVKYDEVHAEKFVSEEARRFCNGIWLEHYVFEKLKSFGFDKKHAMMNVTIEYGKGTRNEVDAIVLHRNTCYVIEDKTKNMQQENVADNAVYKLAQMSSSMGLKTKGILVSALPIRDVDKKRAEAYNVKVCNSLPRLEADLRQILGH